MSLGSICAAANAEGQRNPCWRQEPALTILIAALGVLAWDLGYKAAA
jgi:hypothetical protein